MGSSSVSAASVSLGSGSVNEVYGPFQLLSLKLGVEGSDDVLDMTDFKV